MCYMMGEKEIQMMQEVSDITLTDYEVNGRFVPVSKLMSAIEDLLVELHKKEEDISDLQNDIENNYEEKSINPYEEYGLKESDFYENN